MQSPRKRSSTSSPRKKSATNAPSTPPRPSSSSSSSSSSSPTPKLAIKFNNRIFRSLDKPSMYSSSADFLGLPDEQVSDLEFEKAERKRKEVERELLRSGPGELGLNSTKRALESESGSGSSQKGKGKRRKEEGRIRDLFHSEPTSSTPPTKQEQLPTGLGLPFSAFAPGSPLKSIPSSPSLFSSTTSSLPPLPQSLASLLSLHIKLESALTIYLASEGGSSLASSSSTQNELGQSIIKIPNLINLVELCKRVGRRGNQVFGEKELAKLVWVWEGCKDLSSFTSTSTSTSSAPLEKEEEEEDLHLETGEVGGLGFLVTRTRATTPSGIVQTFGIGISVILKSNPQLPKFELVGPPSSPKSPSSPSRGIAGGGGRDGMSVVALWTMGQEGRRLEFGNRIRDWGMKFAENSDGFPSTLPPIPEAHLPSLSPALPRIPGTLSPSPKKSRPTPTSSSSSSTPSDVFGPVLSSPGSVPRTPQSGSGSNNFLMLLSGSGSGIEKKKESSKDRLNGLAARIQAKADARRTAYQESLSSLAEGSSSTLASTKSLKKDKDIGQAWRVEESMRLKRRSLLSRLGNVADGVWMLFDVGRKRSMLTSEVATSIAKSSKISMSVDEARESLILLCEICPDFVYSKLVEREEWYCVKGLIGLKECKELIREELRKSYELK